MAKRQCGFVGAGENRPVFEELAAGALAGSVFQTISSRDQFWAKSSSQKPPRVR
jgi:hypothetical protein